MNGHTLWKPKCEMKHSIFDLTLWRLDKVLWAERKSQKTVK